MTTTSSRWLDEVEVDLEADDRRRGSSDVVSPVAVTYSGTFHQWLITGVRARRTLPTICVQSCNVSRVGAHSATGNAGHEDDVTVRAPTIPRTAATVRCANVGPVTNASPDALTIDRRAPARRIELDGGSWVDVVDGFVPEHDEQFRRLRDETPWQQTEVLRYERYVPEKRLSASRRGDADPLLRQIGLHLESTYRVRWSGVAALLYRDGDDFQGFHGDRELRWLDDTRIAIVVLGVRRPFVLRPRGPSAQVVDRTPAGQLAGDVVLTPGHGDMLVMGGACQRDWLHAVPRAETPPSRGSR